MGLFDLIADVVTTPLAIVKDTLTLGEAEATKKKLRDIERDVEDIFDDED